MVHQDQDIECCEKEEEGDEMAAKRAAEVGECCEEDDEGDLDPEGKFGHSLRSCFMFEEGYTNFNHGSYGSTPTMVLQAAHAWQAQMEASPDKWMRQVIQVALPFTHALARAHWTAHAYPEVAAHFGEDSSSPRSHTRARARTDRLFGAGESACRGGRVRWCGCSGPGVCVQRVQRFEPPPPGTVRALSSV